MRRLATRSPLPYVLTGAFLLSAACSSGGDPTGTSPDPGSGDGPVAPTITVQPHNVTVEAGSAASFQVTATGTAPLHYQWRRNGTAITGATSPTVDLGTVTASDNAAKFSVVVSNDAGSVTSNEATLTVTTTPQEFTTTPMISATGGFVLALKSNGTVLFWGNGGTAFGFPLTRVTPTVIPDLSNIVQVSAGQGHSLFLKSDGTVLAAGNNCEGQVGTGTVDCVVPLTHVPGLTNVVQVAAGAQTSYAVKSDGTVWQWGYVGFGTSKISTTPIQVDGVSNVVAVSSGGVPSVFNESIFTLALEADGTVWAWGNDNALQLHVAAPPGVTFVYPPVFTGISNIAQISAGAGAFAHVLTPDGFATSWGANPCGQAGNPTPPPSETFPILTKISAGSTHGAAILTDGRVLTFGCNDVGQLGNGEIGPSMPSSFQIAVGLDDIIDIATGFDFTIALRSDGTVWAWGHGSGGTLGDGTDDDQLQPVQVPGVNLLQ
ncbi:MAG TPA: immunoglobulin domain-containing protein [Gemmatimonadaceae bacterium]|nr:immunoglobulin domain-containing protein [Gemmatimonadaceae bacterium]